MSENSDNKLVTLSRGDVKELNSLIRELFQNIVQSEKSDKVLSSDDITDTLKKTLLSAKMEFQKLQKNSILQSENLLDILGSIQVGIIIINEQTHKIVYSNNYASQLLGSAPEMMIGKSCHKFICPMETGNCPVKDQKKRYQLIKAKLLKIDGSRCQVLKSINHITFQGNPCLIETFTDITELKEVQAEHEKNLDELKQISDRLQGIIMSVADWVWETDAKGDFIYCSENVEKIIGYSAAELIGKSFTAYLAPDEIKRANESSNEIVEKEKPFRELENWAIHKNGNRVCVLTSGAPKYNKSGVFTGYSGVNSNITTRKIAENEMIKIKAAIDISSNAIGILSADGKQVYQNKTYTKMFGYELDELKTIHPFSLYDDIKKAEELFERVTSGGKYDQELNMITKNGSHFPVHARVDSVKNKKGDVTALISVFTDITNRKAAERKLKKSEEHLNLAVSIANSGIWDVDLKTHIVTYDDIYYTMAGYKPGEFSSISSEWKKRVHPDDLEEIQTTLTQYLSGITENYRAEYRFLRKNGSYMWLEEKGAIVQRDKNEEPLRFIGAHFDITERKARERRVILLNNLQSRLIRPGSLKNKLKQITDTVISAVDADFARIWELRNSDICEKGCIHYKKELHDKYCLNKQQCLHLLSSSGRYTHIDGDHRRIPLESYKIGKFFASSDTRFLIHDVTVNPEISNHKWAAELGLVSFAGFKLANSEGKDIGVLAVFSKTKITFELETFLESTANLTSQIILNASATLELEKALSESERANNLMAGREIRIRQMKEMINSLSSGLGYKTDFKVENNLESLNTGNNIDLIEARKNALSLAEDAEIARRQAVEANEQLSTIKQAVNSSSDAVAISTINGDFFYVNDTFTKLFAYTITELAVLSESTLFLDSSNYKKSLLTISTGKHFLKELEMRSKDGRIIPIYMRSVPFKDDNGTIIGLVWNFTDITKQRKDQEKITEYTLTIENDLSEKRATLQKAVYLQKSYIQTTLPLLENFTIHALFMPCEHLGGDFFHIIKGIHENKLIIIIGDCTDHGIKASMDASLLSSVVKKNLSLLYAKNRTDLFLKKVNNNYMEFADEDQFPTVFAAIIDIDKKKMYYSNANSETPLVIKKDSIELLEKAAGMHIGYFEDPDYERKCFRFEPGDRLLFFSDAITEIEKVDNNRLGYTGLKKILEKTKGNAENSFKYLIKQLEKENGRLPLNDDTTLIQIDFAEIWEKDFKYNDLAEWYIYHTEIKTMLNNFDYTTAEVEKIGISLDEMCINAFNHGNKMDKSKTVIIKVLIDCKEAVFTITDEGEGFNPELVPDPVANIEEIMERDDQEEFTHGRGIWITKGFIKSMNYNEKGNSVTIRMEKKQRIPL